MSGLFSGLNSLQLVLVGHIRDRVYLDPTIDLLDLEKNIRKEIQNVNIEILRKVYVNMKTRLNFIINEEMEILRAYIELVIKWNKPNTYPNLNISYSYLQQVTISVSKNAGSLNILCSRKYGMNERHWL